MSSHHFGAAQRNAVPIKNSIRTSELDVVSLGTDGAVDGTASSLLVVALGSYGPDRPARIVRAETSPDRFLHQLTGE